MKKRAIIAVFTVVIFAALFTVTAAAVEPFPDDIDKLDMYKLTTEFRRIGVIEETGLLGFLGIDIEIEEINPVERALDSIANIMFYVTSLVGWLSIKIYKLSMGQNLADLFSSGISSILGFLNRNIFDPLFILGIAMTFFIIAKQFMKRNMAGMCYIIKGI